jgi:hypothetical protein
MEGSTVKTGKKLRAERLELRARLSGRGLELSALASQLSASIVP